MFIVVFIYFGRVEIEDVGWGKRGRRAREREREEEKRKRREMGRVGTRSGEGERDWESMWETGGRNKERNPGGR
jgi:hypothetical protein